MTTQVVVLLLVFYEKTSKEMAICVLQSVVFCPPFWELAVVTGRTKKRAFAKSRIPNYSNHSAMLTIELICSHGDLHPHPGPSRASHRNQNGNVAYKIRLRKPDISVFYANSRSLVNKTALSELEIATYLYDFIVFTETHLDRIIDNNRQRIVSFKLHGVQKRPSTQWPQR